MKVLLVALGRMGCRYRDALRRHFPKDFCLVTVDPKQATDQSANHYSMISEVPKELQFDLAIDAHPNQDRFKILQEFLRRGIPYVVIEKPHASSLGESQSMLDCLRLESPSTRVLMPFYERYSHHYQLGCLRQLNAGALQSIVISSGAIGLGCNGIHYIDLANHLFQTDPVEVFARLLPNTVPSPRGTQFMDHAGTLMIQYPQGEFILHMRPDSSVGRNITLIYPHGKVQILEQQEPVILWYRQPEETWGDPFFRTRREMPIEPPCSFERDEVDHMIPAALSDLLNGGSYPTIQDGHKALRIIALAMASHLGKRPLAWQEQVDEKYLQNLTFQFT